MPLGGVASKGALEGPADAVLLAGRGFLEPPRELFGHLGCGIVLAPLHGLRELFGQLGVVHVAKLVLVVEAFFPGLAFEVFEGLLSAGELGQTAVRIVGEFLESLPSVANGFAGVVLERRGVLEPLELFGPGAQGLEHVLGQGRRGDDLGLVLWGGAVRVGGRAQGHQRHEGGDEPHRRECSRGRLEPLDRCRHAGKLGARSR